MSWAQELEELLSDCFPDQDEVKYLKIFSLKYSWIAKSLASVSPEGLITNLKAQPFSLDFDEISTKNSKYEAFMVS